MFVAASSGGSPTNEAWVASAWGEMYTTLDATPTGQVRINLALDNRSSGSLTNYGTYHILKEAAL